MEGLRLVLGGQVSGQPVAVSGQLCSGHFSSRCPDNLPESGGNIGRTVSRQGTRGVRTDGQTPIRGVRCPLVRCGRHRMIHTHDFHLPMSPLSSSAFAARLNTLAVDSASPSEMQPASQLRRHMSSVTQRVPGGMRSLAGGIWGRGLWPVAFHRRHFRARMPIYRSPA